MNPLLKMAMEKVLSDPEMIGSAVKALIDGVKAGAEERKQLRESLSRTQGEVLKLREEVDALNTKIDYLTERRA